MAAILYLPVEHLRGYWRAYLLNFIFVALLLTTHTLAYGDELGSAEFRLGDGEQALLQSSDFAVEVNGLVARVVLKQRFHNPSKNWVEGEYLLPLPTNAAVDYMAMVIGERKIVADIRERGEAQRLYAAAKREGKKATLLDQQRPNLFTQRVANIAPGESIEVELHYSDSVRYDQGRFSLRLPTTLTPRYIPGRAFDHYTDHQIGSLTGSGWALPTPQVPDAHLITPPMQPGPRAAVLSLRADINAGVALARLESLHHPARVQQDGAIQRLRLQPGARLDRDVVLEWEPEMGSAPVAAAFGEQHQGSHYFLLMLLPPQAGEAVALPRETIFVIDTSGSMAGTSILQARQALLSGLEKLKPGDRFNVVEFNSVTRSLWPDAVPASATNLDIAKGFVGGLQANGGTEMKSALEFAFASQAPEGFVRQVVFITDGSVGNEAELFTLIDQRRGNSRLFTVGIGSAPNSHFMQKAAQSGRGSYTYVASEQEVARAMSDLFHKLESPLLTDIQISGAAAAEVFPRAAPDLYAGEPLVLAARFANQPPSALVISGRRNGARFQQALPLPNSSNSSDKATDTKGITKLWARGKLSALYDAERELQSAAGNEQEAQALKTQITQLALDHRLMSKYTSLVAIEQQAARPPWAPLEHQAIPNAMPAGNTMTIPMPAGALGLSTNYAIALLAAMTLLILNGRGLIALTSLRRRPLAQTALVWTWAAAAASVTAHSSTGKRGGQQDAQ